MIPKLPLMCTVAPRAVGVGNVISVNGVTGRVLEMNGTTHRIRFVIKACRPKTIHEEFIKSQQEAYRRRVYVIELSAYESIGLYGFCTGVHDLSTSSGSKP